LSTGGLVGVVLGSVLLVSGVVLLFSVLCWCRCFDGSDSGDSRCIGGFWSVLLWILGGVTLGLGLDVGRSDGWEGGGSALNGGGIAGVVIGCLLLVLAGAWLAVCWSSEARGEVALGVAFFGIVGAAILMGLGILSLGLGWGLGRGERVVEPAPEDDSGPMLNGRGVASVVIGSILLSAGLIMAITQVCFDDCEGCWLRLAVFICLLGGLSLGLGLGLGRGSSGLNGGGVAGVVLGPAMVTFGVVFLCVAMLGSCCRYRSREWWIGMISAVILLFVGGVALGVGVEMGRGRAYDDEDEPEVPTTLFGLEAALGAVAVVVIVGGVIYARKLLKKDDEPAEEHEGDPVREEDRS
jgi:hypothetical protein